MHFHPIAARPDWKKLAAQLGYLSSVFDDPPYWIEALPEPFCAVFEQSEITELIEPATKAIVDLSQEAVEYICNGANSEALFDRLKVPVMSRKAIRQSWNRHDGSICGRLDFSYSSGQLKLLELNFDGAVSLYEASIFQLLWLQELQAQGILPENAMQSNSIHELLINTFAALMPEEEVVHFIAPSADPEDTETVQYLQSCAVLAQRSTKFMQLKDVGYDEEGALVDLDSVVIKNFVKLYPWEWLLKEDAKISEKLGRSVLIPNVENGVINFYEPIWKSLLGNKGILAVLRELSPESPWLLDSAIDGTEKAVQLKKQPHVRKPLFGMQGSSISIVYPDQPEMSITNPGTFGQSGFLIQALHPLPVFQNYHMLVGSWVVNNRPAGIGLRADLSPITTASHCLFVPHYVKPS